LVFGADIIAGFPTETDEMFEATLDHVRQCGLTWLHVFPFSARERTPAARMPQLRGPVVRERAARLRALGDLAVREHLLSLKGQSFDALVEAGDMARSPTFAPVRLAAPRASGEVVRVRVLTADERFAYAEAA
jgi:threonylcarbamoyladenosine tRNA methylthiotransferase MtaB